MARGKIVLTLFGCYRGNILDTVDPLQDMLKQVVERRKVKTDRWRELQVVCDVLNGSKARSYALLRAWDRYQEILRRHATEEDRFLQEAKDGGWGTFKHPVLGRIGISKKIGRALAALIEHAHGGHIKTCRCGTSFVAKRSTRKYCSEHCKQSTRDTDEYRKEKAAYMKDYRKRLEDLAKVPLTFRKKHSKTANRSTS
jgi:hypothetical protein